MDPCSIFRISKQNLHILWTKDPYNSDFPSIFCPNELKTYWKFFSISSTSHSSSYANFINSHLLLITSGEISKSFFIFCHVISYVGKLGFCMVITSFNTLKVNIGGRIILLIEITSFLVRLSRISLTSSLIASIYSWGRVSNSSGSFMKLTVKDILSIMNDPMHLNNMKYHHKKTSFIYSTVKIFIASDPLPYLFRFSFSLLANYMTSAFSRPASSLNCFSKGR